MSTIPIYDMIDKACGITPGRTVLQPSWITMRCPACSRKKRAPRDKSDPPETAIVQATCDKCDNGDFAAILYFRADGSQIMTA